VLEAKEESGARYLLCEYVHWDASRDEWILANSDRLAPVKSHWTTRSFIWGTTPYLRAAPCMRDAIERGVRTLTTRAHVVLARTHALPRPICVIIVDYYFAAIGTKES
jgi:hypothetical protein